MLAVIISCLARSSGQLVVETMQDVSAYISESQENARRIQARYALGPFPAPEYDLPDVIPPHTHVQVYVHIIRTKNNIVYQWKEWLAGYVLRVQEDHYVISYTLDWEENIICYVNVKIADAHKLIRDEPLRLRDERVAAERQMGRERYRWPKHLAHLVVLPSFVYIGAKVTLKINATKCAGWRGVPLERADWRYVSATVMNITPLHVWLKLDFGRYGDDEELVPLCDVEEMLSPYHE